MRISKKKVCAYDSANYHMLTLLKLIKIKEPEKYDGAVALAEEMQTYFIKAAGITELDPIPKD